MKVLVLIVLSLTVCFCANWGTVEQIVNAGIKNGAFPGAVAMIGELLPPFYQLTLIRTNEQKDTKEFVPNC